MCVLLLCCLLVSCVWVSSGEFPMWWLFIKYGEFCCSEFLQSLVNFGTVSSKIMWWIKSSLTKMSLFEIVLYYHIQKCCILWIEECMTRISTFLFCSLIYLLTVQNNDGLVKPKVLVCGSIKHRIILNKSRLFSWQHCCDYIHKK